MIFVDTDVWIDFFNGREPSASSVRTLLVEKRAILSAVTVFELFKGVTGHKRLSQLGELTGIVPVVALSGDHAERAGGIYTELGSRGKLVENEDILLAATALETGVPLMTRNRKHFERIKDLEIVVPKGE